MTERDHCTPKPQQFPGEQIEGATGASDANNGGGSGAGIPDADTGMRVGDEINRGDPKKDKEKLFPDQAAKDRQKAQSTENDLRGV